MILGRKLIFKYLVYFLPIVFLYFLSTGSLGFIWIVYLEVSLIAWNKSNGVWETESNFTEAKKWAKSPLFNGYVFFLLIQYVFNIYFWLVRPSYTSDELEFSSLLFTCGAIWIGSTALNALALFTLVKKGVSRQILLIPILDFLIINMPSFFPAWLWFKAMESYFFAIIALIPLVWVLYIRFIFLNPRPIEDIL